MFSPLTSNIQVPGMPQFRRGRATDGGGTGITARYLRWAVTGAEAGFGCRANEFQVLNAGTPVSWPTAPPAATCNNDFGYPDPVGSSAVVDGVTESFASALSLLVLTVDVGFGETVSFDAYDWYQGGDGFGARPTAWTLEISDDGASWTTIDAQSGFTPTSVGAWQGPFILS